MRMATPAKEAKEEMRQFALGLALTNECNLACSFCYRDPDRVDRLTLDQVRAVMERLPVRSVNLGTGENGMHPDFERILTFLKSQPISFFAQLQTFQCLAPDRAERAHVGRSHTVERAE